MRVGSESTQDRRGTLGPRRSVCFAVTGGGGRSFRLACCVCRDQLSGIERVDRRAARLGADRTKPPQPRSPDLQAKFG
jgi:hypothetical protein